jgi:RNase P/RNase MRP subunit POP5
MASTADAAAADGTTRRRDYEEIVRRSTASSLGELTASTVDPRTNAPAETTTN